MAGRLRLVVGALLVLGAAALLSAPLASAAPPEEPVITAEQDPTGTAFQVTGDGWTPNTLVNLEVCGNVGLGGSADCAVATSQVIGADNTGHFVGLVPIEVPPAPCPCIVRALSQDYREVATAPIEVPGAVTSLPGDVDVSPPILRQLSIESVSLSGSGPWTAWLGGSPERTLKLTIVNTGAVAIQDAVVNLTVGKGDDPTGFVPPIRIDPLDVGESATYETQIELGALAFGEYTVAGEIKGIAEPTTFSATTTSYPWLLIIVPIVLIVQLVLVGTRNRLRRRLHPEEVADQPDAQADDDGVADSGTAVAAGAVTAGAVAAGAADEPDRDATDTAGDAEPAGEIETEPEGAEAPNGDAPALAGAARLSELDPPRPPVQLAPPAAPAFPPPLVPHPAPLAEPMGPAVPDTAKPAGTLPAPGRAFALRRHP